MENQTQSNIPPAQTPPPAFITPPPNRSKILLLTVVGLSVVTGLVLLGIQIGKQFTTPVHNKTVINPTLVPTIPNSVSDLTINWKTYTNSEFDFQIKYPDDWSLKEDKSLQGLALITVTISAPSRNTLLDIWVRSGTWDQAKNELKAKSSKIVINGIEGLVETITNGKVYAFPSKRNGQVIQIIYSSSSDSPSNELLILNQILSTFQYVN